MSSRRSQLNAERTEATRSRLLRHARHVFEKQGYGAASVADIVNTAGVARGTFYVHFKSKREVFIAVVGAVRAELVAAQMRPVEGSRTVAGAVRNGIEQYLKAYKASARMIGLIEDTAISDRAVKSAWLETRNALTANTEHALERLRARGLAHYEGTTRTVALSLGAMVERMGAVRYVLGYPFDDDEFFGTLTAAYLNAARIVGDYQLEPRVDDFVDAMATTAPNGDERPAPGRRRRSATSA
jgi:AcrR family transcriptional regulator